MAFILYAICNAAALFKLTRFYGCKCMNRRDPINQNHMEMQSDNDNSVNGYDMLPVRYYQKIKVFTWNVKPFANMLIG